MKFDRENKIPISPKREKKKNVIVGIISRYKDDFFSTLSNELEQCSKSSCHPQGIQTGLASQGAFYINAFKFPFDLRSNTNISSLFTFHSLDVKKCIPVLSIFEERFSSASEMKQPRKISTLRQTKKIFLSTTYLMRVSSNFCVFHLFFGPNLWTLFPLIKSNISIHLSHHLSSSNPGLNKPCHHLRKGPVLTVLKWRLRVLSWNGSALEPCW